jgi:excinuclease ABC subunit B
MYADTITASMQHAIDETNRRREIQEDYNHRHGITPQTIKKMITPTFTFDSDNGVSQGKMIAEAVEDFESLADFDERLRRMEKEMHDAARDLEFEKAAALRDRIHELKKRVVFEQQF